MQQVSVQSTVVSKGQLAPGVLLQPTVSSNSQADCFISEGSTLVSAAVQVSGARRTQAGTAGGAPGPDAYTGSTFPLQARTRHIPTPLESLGGMSA